MQNKRALVGVGLAGAFLLVSGCGKAADKIAEKATEKAVESAAGGGNLDISGDGFTFESDDGTISYEMDDDGNVVMKGPDGEVMTADSDGNMTMSGADGETTYTAGEKAELPDGWPEFLALPDGATIVTSSTTSDGDVKTGTVMIELDSEVEATYEDVKEALEDEGFEIGSDSFTESSDGDFASVSGDKGDRSVSVTIGSGGSEKPFMTMTVTGI